MKRTAPENEYNLGRHELHTQAGGAIWTSTQQHASKGTKVGRSSWEQTPRIAIADAVASSNSLPSDVLSFESGADMGGFFFDAGANQAPSHPIDQRPDGVVPNFEKKFSLKQAPISDLLANKTMDESEIFSIGDESFDLIENIGESYDIPSTQIGSSSTGLHSFHTKNSDQFRAAIPATTTSFSACKPICSQGKTYAQRKMQGTKKWEESDPANSQIIKELNELSLKERENLFEDMHGVADHVVETEEFLNDKLKQMQQAVLRVREKPAYERARFLSTEAVHDRSLRLSILRSLDYSPYAAARRLVAYYQMKLDLFGLDKLVKHPITQDDLTLGMKEALRDGHTQTLLTKDRVGRSIVFVDPTKQIIDKDWRNYFGATWYILSEAIRDENTQRVGMIYVINFFGTDKINPNFTAMTTRSIQFDKAFPVRVGAFHFCYDRPLLKPLISILQLTFMNSRNRLRVRTHFGSHMECAYQLMSYGISLSQLPVDSNGETIIASRLKQLDKLQMQERAERRRQEQSSVIIPTSADCALGRGQPYQSFVGNIFLAEMIERNRELYSNAHRDQKTNISLAIVEYIQVVRGSRFLRKVDEQWELVEDAEARRKVAHQFRAPVRRNLEFDAASKKYEAVTASVTIFVPLEEMDKLLGSSKMN